MTLNKSRFIIGLVGFRCSGKSTLRRILSELNIPVFNTNSVSTGDADEHHISLKETLTRYGKNKSFLLYLEEPIKKFIDNKNGIIFIDSFKIPSDVDVMNEMFPNDIIRVWYLHASTETRQRRYLKRDLMTNFREQKLAEHDISLEEYGIWELIKSAKEVINMEKEIEFIKQEVLSIISKYNIDA